MLPRDCLSGGFPARHALLCGHLATACLSVRLSSLQVLDALPLLLALRRLRRLSLINNSGLNTLPQLHPLLQLRRLSHLTLQDCPICSLALLRPYVAFR